MKKFLGICVICGKEVKANIGKVFIDKERLVAIHDKCSGEREEFKPILYEEFGYTKIMEVPKRLGNALKENVESYPILDVGCGDGNVMEFLGGKFEPGRIKGIDISQKAINICRKRDLNASKEDFLDFKTKEKFGTIIMIGFMAHVDPEKFLEKVKKIIKKDGTLLLSIKNKNSLKKSYNPQIYNRFSNKEFTELLNKHGFKSVKIISLGRLPISLSSTNLFIAKLK